MIADKRITKDLKDLNLLVDDTESKIILYEETETVKCYTVHLVDGRRYNFEYLNGKFVVFTMHFKLPIELCLEYYNKLEELSKDIKPVTHYRFEDNSLAREYFDHIVIYNLSSKRYFKDFDKVVVLCKDCTGLDYDSKIVGGPQKIYCKTKSYKTTINEITYLRTIKKFWNGKKFEKVTIKKYENVIEKTNELHYFACFMLREFAKKYETIHRYGNGSVYIHENKIIMDNDELLELYKSYKLDKEDTNHNLLEGRCEIMETKYGVNSKCVCVSNGICINFNEKGEYEIPQINHKGITSLSEYKNEPCFKINVHKYSYFRNAYEFDDLIFANEKLKKIFSKNTKKVIYYAS